MPRDYDYRQHPAYDPQNYTPLGSQQQPGSSPYQINGASQQPHYLNGNGYQQMRAYPDVRYPGGLSNPAHNQMPVPAFAGQWQRSPADAMRQQTQGPGSITRNLIGQVSSSATQLKDLDKKPGLWFIFQDLSVRTEGVFRLKFSFFDLQDGKRPDRESGEPESAESVMLARQAPMLAQAYSKPFQVFSAKKFPGVIESTLLSKEFAKQGIKIPIRKDAKENNKRRLGSYDGDEDEAQNEED